MGILSIVLIVIWASLIFDGIYGLVKGYFYGEQKKAEKHDPNAYRKWIKISSVFLILCGAINVILSIVDDLADAFNWKYLIYMLIATAVFIATIAIAYSRIVKPADKALGIESEFDKILKEDKK